MLTPRQKQVHDFISKVIARKGVAPSEREVARHFRISASTAHEHLDTLKKRGYLEKEPGRPRAMRVVQPPEMLVRIPLFGTIAAGSPIEAIRGNEMIAVPKNKIPSSSEVYALRVVGNSMIDESINDGDIVLVKHQATAENGQKVVALIDNHEATLKKFYKERGHIRLQPANKEIGPIIIKKDRELTIQGIVVDVVKKEPAETIDIVSSITERKKPRGGCELAYPGKIDEHALLTRIEPSKLKLVKKYGKASENRLIQGDNLSILRNLYADKAIKGKVKLVYIDPPFGTGQEFVGYDEENRYSDQVVNMEFLEFLRKRLILLRELLADSGSIYVHIDQKIGHYVKIILDEVFGEENFRNDITRIKCNPKNFERKAFGNMKDVVYFYSKSKSNGDDPMMWTDYREPLSEEEIAKQFPKIDKYGRRYATTPLHAKGETMNGPTGKPWKGLKPPRGRHWRYSPDELTRLDKQGLIEWSSTGNPRKIIYADESRGRKIQDVWDFRDPGYEKSRYPTEKNEGLLEQIIKASSNEDDIVLDCFAGSGTTIAVAEKLKRKWVGIDLNKAAVKVAEKRILEIRSDGGLFNKQASFGVYQVI